MLLSSPLSPSSCQRRFDSVLKRLSWGLWAFPSIHSPSGDSPRGIPSWIPPFLCSSSVSYMSAHLDEGGPHARRLTSPSCFRLLCILVWFVVPQVDFVSFYFPPRFASRNSTFCLTGSHSSATVRMSITTQTPGALTNRIVLEHAERAVSTRTAEGHEEACHGHRHEAHRDGS